MEIKIKYKDRKTTVSRDVVKKIIKEIKDSKNVLETK